MIEEAARPEVGASSLSRGCGVLWALSVVGLGVPVPPLMAALGLLVLLTSIVAGLLGLGIGRIADVALARIGRPWVVYVVIVPLVSLVVGGALSAVFFNLDRVSRNSDDLAQSLFIASILGGVTMAVQSTWFVGVASLLRPRGVAPWVVALAGPLTIWVAFGAGALALVGFTCTWWVYNEMFHR